MNLTSENVTSEILASIRAVVGDDECDLHVPILDERDKDRLAKVVDSSFVSSVGPDIGEFEEVLSNFTGAPHVVAVSNGTSALMLAFIAAQIPRDSEVLVPALTFVGTCNAILHAGLTPHFIDSEGESLGINVDTLRKYLVEVTKWRNGQLINKETGRAITAIVPVHLFGHVMDMSALRRLASEFNLAIIEDAAEALGSFRNDSHAGCFGICGILSFNGNKIITTGGGGAILTEDELLASRARHLATTAKVQGRLASYHDALGYNLRMPALNAALGCSQMSKLDKLLKAKKKLFNLYREAFSDSKNVSYFIGPSPDTCNHWLNTILLNDDVALFRDEVCISLNRNGIGARPIWSLLSTLPHLDRYPSMILTNSSELASKIINIPSSAKLAERAMLRGC